MSTPDQKTILDRSRAFAEIADAGGLHGLMFQHFEICPRRAWLHVNRIDYAHLEERMAIGTVAHDLSKVRDRSVEGLIGLAPDRVDYAQRIVVEAKGKAGAGRAVERQAIFYAIMLTGRTGSVWRGAVDVIEERRTRIIDLDEEICTEMTDIAQALSGLFSAPCPEGIDAPICQTCSYGYLCGRKS